MRFMCISDNYKLLVRKAIMKGRNSSVEPRKEQFGLRTPLEMRRNYNNCFSPRTIIHNARTTYAYKIILKRD